MSVGGFSKLQDRESTGAGSIAHSPESTIVVEVRSREENTYFFWLEC